MKHYHLQFTEQNGEQQYTYDYIFKAENEEDAWDKAKEFLETWYSNYEGEEREWQDEDTLSPYIEYEGGSLSARIEYINETTIEEFKTKMVERYSFGAI